MTPNGNSLGLDAEDEAQARRDETVGYDSELDDEYDTVLDGERRPERNGFETEEDEEEPERLAGYASVPPAEVESEPDADADAAEPGSQMDAERLAEPDTDEAAYEGTDFESASETPLPSAPDSEPGLENEERYHQEPEIVGAVADLHPDQDQDVAPGQNQDQDQDVLPGSSTYPDRSDDGLDEVDGRAEFDQTAAAENVAGYDDSAAAYELAEETPAQGQPVAQLASTTVSEPLLSAETQGELLQRWTAIQVAFVDNPGESVRSAEALISDIGTAMQEAIRARSEQIAGSWQDSTDTEQLRLSLQEYRSFLGVVLPK